MSAATAWSPALLIAILCGSGCLGSYSRAVDETRSGLLGLAGRDLRECLGVPSDFVIDGDVEQQSYYFEHVDELDAAYGTGDVDGGLGGRMPGDRGYDPQDFPRDDPDASYCQLDFELSKGRVTRVSAQGRTSEGMNADASCLLRARRCLPYAGVEGVDATE